VATSLFRNHLRTVKRQRSRWARYEDKQDKRYSFTHTYLSTRWRWVINFKSRPLYPWGKNPPPPQHPLKTRRTPTGLDVLKKTAICCSSRESNPGCSPVSLHWLSYHGPLPTHFGIKRRRILPHTVRLWFVCCRILCEYGVTLWV
jgi:hypothetical protein